MPYKLAEVAQSICDLHDCTLIDYVGHGTFKETYHIRLPSGHSEALKVFGDANSPERTQREIDAMVRCNHPNIGKLSSINVFPHEGMKYLYTTEEYLPGGTLARKIENELLSFEEIVAFGEALISAVEHIASQDLVHRDLKPENIMFREDGYTPVIVDFGLVRDLAGTSLTKSWAVTGPGTPYYAAPEQLLNEKELIDWRTDQFALAILLSESAFGYHPYSEIGDNPAQVIERVLQKLSPAVRFYNDANQYSLSALIRMAEPWPVHRYRRPTELLAAWRAQTRGTE